MAGENSIFDDTHICSNLFTQLNYERRKETKIQYESNDPM